MWESWIMKQLSSETLLNNYQDGFSSQVVHDLRYSYPYPRQRQFRKPHSVPICSKEKFYKLSWAWAWVLLINCLLSSYLMGMGMNVIAQRIRKSQLLAVVVVVVVAVVEDRQAFLGGKRGSPAVKVRTTDEKALPGVHNVRLVESCFTLAFHLLSTCFPPGKVAFHRERHSVDNKNW